MKKFYLTLFILFSFQTIRNINLDSIIGKTPGDSKPSYTILNEYQYPNFYRGIYLNSSTAKNFNKLMNYVKRAKEANINTFILDLQNYKYRRVNVPAENIYLCLINGIHPVARIVVFPLGLKNLNGAEYIIAKRIDLAEKACQKGFKEIQLDYIRFNDSDILPNFSYNQRYQFIKNILLKTKKRLAKYKVRISADIFGRIPLVEHDQIGQRMEVLDEVADIICPMAYPSHYWSQEQQHNPYQTVYETSLKAKERTKQAEIVTYIQAFKMRMPAMPFTTYIEKQIEATHDAKIKGFILWNARQAYRAPLKAVKNFYANYTPKEDEEIEERGKKIETIKKIKRIKKEVSDL